MTLVHGCYRGVNPEAPRDQLVPHAWVEIKAGVGGLDRAVAFDGTVQTFYDRDSYRATCRVGNNFVVYSAQEAIALLDRHNGLAGPWDPRQGGKGDGRQPSIFGD